MVEIEKLTIQKIIKKILDYKNEKISDIMFNLKARWIDEREYEDWKDYADVMKDFVKEMKLPEITFIKATKRPFGFVMNICGKPIICYIKDKGSNYVVAFKLYNKKV